MMPREDVGATVPRQATPGAKSPARHYSPKAAHGGSSREAAPPGLKMKGLRGGRRREAVCFLSGVSTAPQQDFRHTRGVSGVSPSDIAVGGRGEPQVVGPRVTARVPDLQPALDTGTPRDRPLRGAGWGKDTRGVKRGD